MTGFGTGNHIYLLGIIKVKGTWPV